MDGQTIYWMIRYRLNLTRSKNFIIDFLSVNKLVELIHTIFIWYSLQDLRRTERNVDMFPQGMVVSANIVNIREDVVLQVVNIIIVPIWINIIQDISVKLVWDIIIWLNNNIIVLLSTWINYGLWYLNKREKKYAATKDVVPVINTLRAGYGKVLGKGNLPNQPVIVKTRFVSRRAEEKIKKVGGIVQLVA